MFSPAHDLGPEEVVGLFTRRHAQAERATWRGGSRGSQPRHSHAVFFAVISRGSLVATPSTPSHTPHTRTPWLTGRDDRNRRRSGGRKLSHLSLANRRDTQSGQGLNALLIRRISHNDINGSIADLIWALPGPHGPRISCFQAWRAPSRRRHGVRAPLGDRHVAATPYPTAPP